jgi:hypothetical protein
MTNNISNNGHSQDEQSVNLVEKKAEKSRKKVLHNIVYYLVVNLWICPDRTGYVTLALPDSFPDSFFLSRFYSCFHSPFWG